jgi:hypothetical protein
MPGGTEITTKSGLYRKTFMNVVVKKEMALKTPLPPKIALIMYGFNPLLSEHITTP